MTDDEAPVGAIVLAAGASSRMGAAKQLFDVDGRSLVRRAAEAACDAGCAPVVVVVGAQAERVRAALDGLGVAIAFNPGWREGIASSLRCGVEALPEGVSAAIVLLCDQPAVSPGLLESLIRRRRESGRPIVACRYGSVTGVPALFARELFPQLLALEGDAGARSLLARAGDEVESVGFPDGAFDLDTPEDWARWRARERV